MAHYWQDDHGMLHDMASGVAGPGLWVSAQGELLREDEVRSGERVSLLVPGKRRAATAEAVAWGLHETVRGWARGIPGLAQAS